MTVRKEGERDEIFLAFCRVHNPRNAMISRQAIEHEINTHPELYPILSGQSSRYVKQVITVTMNTRYLIWNNPTAGKRANWVWVVASSGGIPA